MKNKKLILINLLTLAAFILVVGAGIYRAEATKDDFGKPKETEKIDLEVSKKEKETMEIAVNEGAELITPATFMKKFTIGSVAFRHANLFSVVDTTTEDGEEVVNEEIIVEAEEEDSEAEGYTNRSTQEKHTVHPKKENIPQTTIVNKSEKEQVRSKETIKQDANKEKEVKEPVKEPVKEKPVDDNEKESTTSTKPTASPEKTESSQPENPELQPDKENSGEDEKPEDTQNTQDEQDEQDEEQSPTSDEERIKEF